MKHKKLFITLTVVLSVLITLGIFLTIWFWGDSYKGGNDYEGFDNFRKEVKIPGLADGACPQGIANLKAKYTVKDAEGKPVLGEDGKERYAEQQYFFISAYFKNAPSRIYVTGEETGYVGYVTLRNTDGSIYKGHCGGIATNGYTLWVVSDDTVYVARGEKKADDNIAYDLIKAAESNGEIKFTASFAANCNASFCYFYNADGDWTNSTYASDRFYVGEFYRDGNYPTAERHHITTKNGDKNTAFVYEYQISTSTDYGLIALDNDINVDKKVPKIQAIYSITDEIQGFARIDGGLVLSQSYGLKNSVLYYHSWSKITESANRVQYKDLKYINEKGEEKTYGGFEYADVKFNSGAQYKDTNVYVYYVDGGTLANKYSIPSMSEGLCVSGKRVYVLFESGAKKYSTFVRQVLDSVYSFIPRTKR
ncbi:MAG: hypothetical protein K2K80_01070 [Clostridia bacterium]|nr:hypothetical protein [Clostridia bacterium]